MEKSANEVTDLSLNMAEKSWAYFLKRLNHGKFRPKEVPLLDFRCTIYILREFRSDRLNYMNEWGRVYHGARNGMHERLKGRN